MAILGTFTNLGISKSQDAANNEGFKITPLTFGVSDITGPLNPARTTPNTLWFQGPISSRVVIDYNTIKFVCTIPPGATPVIRTAREIYLFAEDSLLNEFLMIIGQPSTPITYDPSGSVTFELQLSLTNVDLSSIITFAFTQATEINEHNTSPNAHPEIVEAINKAGIYFNLGGGPESFKYRGQNFDEKAQWDGVRASATHGGVTFTATNYGTDGNLISLVFDGILTTDQVRLVWNNANPYNTVEHNGTGFEVPPVAIVPLINGTLLVSAGDVVYRDVDGLYKRALADGTIKAKVAGVADLDSPIKRVVRSAGFITRDTTGFNVGDDIFLSTSTPGALTNVSSPVKLGIVVATNRILIGTGGGGGAAGDGYNAIVTDDAGFGKYPTTAQAIAATPDGGRILVDKLEQVSTMITTGGKRIDFYFNGPEAGWTKYLGTAEKQKITFSTVPDSGTFRIEWNGNESADLPFNATALDIENEINAMTGPGLPVTVTGDFTLGFDVQWTSLIDVPQITFNNLGQNEIQRLSFDAIPTNGTIRLDFNGQLTANLAWNDDAFLLEAYLEGLLNISDVTVGGSFAIQQFTIEWVGVDGKQNKTQLLVDANTLQDGITPVNPTIVTLQEGKLPASNLKTGITPVGITVQTLIGGTPVGPGTAFQVGADYTRFVGLGKVDNFDSGVDLNGFIGADVELLFTNTITPIINGGLTGGSDYHSQKSFGINQQRIRVVGTYGDYKTLWDAVVDANPGDRILVTEDQSLLVNQVINKDVEIVFTHNSQINVPGFLSGNLLALGTKTKTKFMKMVISDPGSYDTAFLLTGTRGYHEDLTLESSNGLVTVDYAFRIDVGATAIFAHGILSRGASVINNGLTNSSGYNSHDVVIRDIEGGVVYNSATAATPLQETPTGVVDGINDTFVLAAQPLNPDSVLVMVDGIPRAKSTVWNLSGSSIIFQPSFLPQTGQDVYVLYFPVGPFTTPPRNLEILKNNVTQLFSPKRINFSTGFIVTVDNPDQVTVDFPPGGVDFTLINQDPQPITDAAHSLGTHTKSWNDVWLRDKTTGDKYRLEVDNGVLQAVLVP